jgi:hypothetical protein
MTVSTGQNVTFAQAANLPNTFGFKNRIINGAMVIDQRNAGASVSFAGGNFPVDRMRLSVNNSGSATANTQQNLNSLTPPLGFTNYIGMTVTNGTSMASGEAWRITQRIEGNNVADLGWGAAGASAVTLSFWVRSNLTGTFGGVLQNDAGNRVYIFSYAINSANTWEYKSVVVPGDTSGTWLKNNGIGILLIFSVGCGTAVQGTAGAWGSTFLDSVTGQVNVMATNGNTFYITGVQLEKGSTATSFDYRPYGTELQLCQRYCQSIRDANTGFIGYARNTTQMFAIYQYPVVMRGSPTATLTAANTFGVVAAGAFSTPSAIALDTATTTNAQFLATTTGLTGGWGGSVYLVTGTIVLSAEL